MGVTLAYALQNGAFVHITEKIEKETPIFCPHCKDAVIAKKGAKMQHHFAHKPYARCRVSAESILHFESKMYLKQLILHKAPVTFQAKVSLLDEKIQRWYTLLGSQHADIPLHGIIEAYGVQNATEETGILGYIPDILGIGKHSFAFEIFVTHALEEKKIEAFKRAGVDYIELIPTREEDGTFSFVVHDAHLPRFYGDWRKKIEQDFEHTIRPQLYEELKENEEELMERVKKEVHPQIMEEVCHALQTNIERFYVTYGEKLTRKQEKVHRVCLHPSYEEGETLRLKEALVRYGKNGLPYVVLRDEYKRTFTIDGTIPLFAAFLNELNQHYDVSIMTNEKGNIDGLQFMNTLDKIGFDEEVQQLLKRNLQNMQQQLNENKR